MSVNNGNTANQTTFNNAFVSRTTDTSTTGKVDLSNVQAESGSSVTNVQREHNAVSSWLGKALNVAFDNLPTWASDIVGSVNDSIKLRVEALVDLFHGTTGHTHSGVDGDGPAIDFDASSPLTTKGDILGHDGTGNVSVPAGTNGQVLTANNAVTNGIEWQTPSSSPVALDVRTETTTYTIDPGDDVILFDATGGGFTSTLPTAVGNEGKVFYLKKIDSTFNQVMIDADGSETIDGALSITLATEDEEVAVVSDNSDWQILSRSYKKRLPAISFTPNNFGTIAEAVYYGHRDGAFLVAHARFVAGTVAGALASMNMPSGLVIDNTNIPGTYTGSGGTAALGLFYGGTTAANQLIYQASPSGAMFYDGSDTGKVFFAYRSGIGFAKDNADFIFNPNAGIWMEMRIPIVGWE